MRLSCADHCHSKNKAESDRRILKPRASMRLLFHSSYHISDLALHYPRDILEDLAVQ